MTQFRLMTGDHSVLEVQRAPDGRVVGELSRILTAGAVIESELDLCAMFNKPGIRPKFETLHDSGKVTGHVWNPAVETLESFTERMRSAHSSAQPTTVTAPLPVPYFPQGTAPPRQSPPKFEPINDHGGTTTSVSSQLTDAQLQVMDLNLLRAHCEGEEIPFDPAADKAQLVGIIKAFQGVS